MEINFLESLDWTQIERGVTLVTSKPKHKARPKKLIARVKKGIENLPPATRLMPICCECCGRPRSGQLLRLDHDHATGAFRGWLCSNCNLAIGMLGDNIKGISLALAYLRRTVIHG